MKQFISTSAQIFPVARYSWVVYMIQAYELAHRTKTKQQSRSQMCSPKFPQQNDHVSEALQRSPRADQGPSNPRDV